MLRQARNELTIEVRIEGKSPLLIKDGRESKNKGEKDLPSAVFQSRLEREDIEAAVRGKRLDPMLSGLVVPGSSIRGAVRSHLEKALRSLDEEPKVCDPFIGVGSEDDDHERESVEEQRPDASCSSRLSNKEASAPVHAYRDSCPICQLFGNTAQGSRIAFGEGRFTGGKPALIDNNAISRQTGAAISPFKSLVVLNAVVIAELQIRNFELWQAGLLARLFDDLKNGFVRLGSGKSKGWGRITAKATSMTLTYFGLDNRLGEGKLLGVAEMIPGGTAEAYGMTQCAKPPELPAFTQDAAASFWRQTATIHKPEELWDQCRPFFDKATWASVKTLAARRAAAGTERA